MNKVIFINRSPDDNGIRLVGDLDTVQNLGPIGGVGIKGKELEVPLLPEPKILSTSPYKSDTITLTGEYAVEVDGVMVPYIFKPEDLPKFFDGKNPAAGGLVISLPV